MRRKPLQPRPGVNEKQALPTKYPTSTWFHQLPDATTSTLLEGGQQSDTVALFPQRYHSFEGCCQCQMAALVRQCCTSRCPVLKWWITCNSAVTLVPVTMMDFTPWLLQFTGFNRAANAVTLATRRYRVPQRNA